MVKLVLVLGDQLSTGLSALAQADRDSDVIVMAEVASEAEYVPHHPKKIAFSFTAMRKFAAQLCETGWRVAYTRLDDPENAGSIPAELLRRADEFGTSTVLATEPGEWRLIEALRDMPLDLTLLPDDRFLCSHVEFECWAEGRKVLRMEYFYREMRRKTGLLMDGDQPEGGKWNYDHENRKPASDDLFRKGPPKAQGDPVLDEVLDLVETRFPSNFGALRPFHFQTDRAGALRALNHFIEHALPEFGTYQDAMLEGDPYLYHAVIGLYLNAGLLGPMEVCEKAAAAYRGGHAPLNSVEGFIRQIIGWREYIRGIYFLEGPEYPRRNALNHQRKLPAFYWGGETRMNCVAQAVGQTRDLAYAHHIQRLMVTGNFALLAGINPHEVHEWYLAVYTDAYEWVEAPNTVGMSQFADGGIVASKPYVSSGAYIDRMSDYCRNCHYRVKDKTGARACPFNLLYWHFLIRHREHFESNPRMAQMYRTFDRMEEGRRTRVLEEAEDFLERMSRGDLV
ncbi:MAG: cryptochrome/photolyase family protein [Rhodobacteraceae bacterium]|nr:MAG: cryptochrome/photolyase family protein [Paracoccaceae bacterium]